MPVASSPRLAASLTTRVMVPHGGLDGFREALGSLWTAFPQARALAWRLFLRDTRAAHRQSLLGYLWILLPPLVNTLVWVLLNRSEVVKIESGAVPYPVFVLVGTVLWAAFNGAIMAILGVVSDARGMLAKVNFPHEALVYAALLKALVEALVPALLLVPALWFYKVPVQSGLWLFPVTLLAALVVGLACGLILVPIASLYSDVGRAVQLALRFGFFVTPVIFPLPAAGIARSLILLNPLTAIIVSGRAWLAGSGEIMPTALVAILLGALMIASIGLLVFKVALPHLIERLSA